MTMFTQEARRLRKPSWRKDGGDAIGSVAIGNRILHSGVDEASITPNGVVATVAVTAVEDAKCHLLRAGDIDVERMNRSLSENIAFRLQLAVDQHLELHTAALGRRVDSDLRGKCRKLLARNVHYDIGRRGIGKSVRPDGFWVGFAADRGPFSVVVAVAMHGIARAGSGFSPRHVGNKVTPATFFRPGVASMPDVPASIAGRPNRPPPPSSTEIFAEELPAWRWWKG